MAFIDDFKDVKNKVRTDITQSQLILQESLIRCGLNDKSPQEQYENIYQILDARNDVHDDIIRNGLKEDVSVTGAVTELICKIALDAVAEGRYDKLPKSWDWIGDFAIMGSPFNLFVSVKSYTARERLIVSGTGQNTAPVIGYGLFQKTNEWSPERVKQYKQRGFIAIYMPNILYDELAAMIPSTPGLSKRKKKQYSPENGYPATNITNIYDRPLLRKIEDFGKDVENILIPGDYTLELAKF